MYYVEQEQLLPGDEVARLAMPGQLGFGDMRVLLHGRDLFSGRLDFHFDMRVRATTSFDYERKFDPQPLAASPQSLSARGYLGGPEYDLREAYLTLRFRDHGSLQLGRQFVPEADMLKVDALRMNLVATAHLTLSLFGGGLPNPYSRSLLSDYTPPCGSGVAAGDRSLHLQSPLTGTPSDVTAATGSCQTAGAQFAFAGGLTAAYQAERLWGNLGLVGTFLTGDGDGGVLTADPMRSNTVSNLAAPNFERDAPRIFLSSNTHIRPTDKFDVYANLVLDFFGSGGAQLTRALLSGNLRALRDDRLSLHLTYAHMSALAMNMFLNRQLYNRTANGSTLAGLGIVENNLTVLRTGRDELRLGADLKLRRRLVGNIEGRFRYRSLLNGDSNPAVYATDLYNANTRNVAGDFAIGVRDGGSLHGVRAAANYMFLGDFRAFSHLLRVALGRGFLSDRINLDLDYSVVLVTDAGANGNACNANQFPALGALQVYQLNPAVSVFVADCYGRRNGTTHEIGTTLTTNPWRRLFFLADYRFTALLTDPQGDIQVPTLFAHTVLLRAEYGI